MVDPVSSSEVAPATLLLFEHGKLMRFVARGCLIGACGMEALCVFGLVLVYFSAPDPSVPHAFAAFVVFVGFFSLVLLFAIWNLFETDRRRLAIREDGVFLQGVFGRREILWKDVVAISWSNWGYAITVASPMTSIVISTQFAREDQRRWLTEFFRGQFSKKIQHQYRQYRANGLLGRLPCGEPVWLQRCKSILFGVGFTSAIIAMIAGWWMPNGVLVLSGFGLWGLLAAIGFIGSGIVWRRVVERLGTN